MLNLQKMKIEPFVEELTSAYKRAYGLLEPELASILAWSSHLALENIAKLGALLQYSIIPIACHIKSPENFQ